MGPQAIAAVEGFSAALLALLVSPQAAVAMAAPFEMTLGVSFPDGLKLLPFFIRDGAAGAKARPHFGLELDERRRSVHDLQADGRCRH